MGWSCNLFGRVISITSPETLDGETGRNSSKKKRRKGRRRGGPMDDEEEEVSSNVVDYRCAPHPALPPAVYHSQSMARSVFYSNDSPVVIMQAPTTGFSPAPPTTSYAYAGAPSVVPVVMEQQAPAPSKSRVRFALPGGGGQNNDEPVVAMPVGASTGVAEMYYQPPQHDQYHQVVQQHSNGNQQQIVRHEETTGHVPAVFGAYQPGPPPLSFMHPAAATPEYGHYNYSYPTPRREAVYRIGTDTNRFSMFSDENPNACAIS